MSEEEEGEDILDEVNPESEGVSPVLQGSPTDGGVNQNNHNLRVEEDEPNGESPEEDSGEEVLPPGAKRLKTEPENNHN
jgi:hypothetical protein